MQRLSFIYLLHDNNTPLYIGMTKGLTERYIQHHNTLYADYSKGAAIYKMLLTNRMCDIKILAVCNSGIDRAVEYQFIAHYKTLGLPISNTLGTRGDTRRERCFFKKIAFRRKNFMYFIERVKAREKSLLFFYSPKLLNDNDFCFNFTDLAITLPN